MKTEKRKMRRKAISAKKTKRAEALRLYKKTIGYLKRKLADEVTWTERLLSEPEEIKNAVGQYAIDIQRTDTESFGKLEPLIDDLVFSINEYRAATCPLLKNIETFNGLDDTSANFEDAQLEEFDISRELSQIRTEYAERFMECIRAISVVRTALLAKTADE